MASINKRFFHYSLHGIFSFILWGIVNVNGFTLEKIPPSLIRYFVAPKLEIQDRKNLALVSKRLKELFPVKSVKILNAQEDLNQLETLTQLNGLSVVEMGKSIEKNGENDKFLDDVFMLNLLSIIRSKSNGNKVQIKLGSLAIIGLARLIPNYMDLLGSHKYDFFLSIHTKQNDILESLVKLSKSEINIKNLNVMISRSEINQKDEIENIIKTFDKLNRLEEIEVFALWGDEEEMLSYFNLLKRKILSRCENSECMQLKKFRYVAFGSSNVAQGFFTDKEIQTIIHKNINLEVLSEICLDGKSLRRLLPLKKLQDLHLKIINDLGWEDICALCDVIKNSTHLESLTLDISLDISFIQEDEKYQFFVHQILTAISLTPSKFKWIKLDFTDGLNVENAELLNNIIPLLNNCTYLHIYFFIMDNQNRVEFQQDFAKRMITGIKSLSKLETFGISTLLNLRIDFPSGKEVADLIFEYVKTSNKKCLISLLGIFFCDTSKYYIKGLVEEYNKNQKNEKMDISRSGLFKEINHHSSGYKGTIVHWGD